MKIKECMCNEVAYLNPENTVKDCAKLMCNRHIGCVPVCDLQKNIVGLVTDRDLILRSIACDKDISNTPISDIMTSKVCTCFQNEEVEYAQKVMSEHQIRRLPVIDENNKIIGIVTIGDLCSNKDINTNEVCKTLENICNCNNKNAE